MPDAVMFEASHWIHRATASAALEEVDGVLEFWRRIVDRMVPQQNAQLRGRFYPSCHTECVVNVFWELDQLDVDPDPVNLTGLRTHRGYIFRALSSFVSPVLVRSPA
jgi:hypothetical protein